MSNNAFLCIQNGLSLYGSCQMHTRTKNNTFVVLYSAKNCTNRKNIHKEKACNDGYINIWIPHKFIHTINKKAIISFITFIHFRTHHYRKKICQEFKHRGSFQDVLCHSDYEYRGVVSFSHQIQINNMVAIYICLLEALYWRT